MYFSVITPTYNRAYILNKCYESLKNQTFKDFEWIIIDDGSSDNTKELVKSFIAENVIDVKYIYQENGGKHRAHNTGVKASTGVLTVCLDSDDLLTPEALERAHDVWEKKGGVSVSGILAKRGDLHNGIPICSSMPKGIERAKMFDLSYKYGFQGDTVIFIRTDLLRKHFFKEFSGEKFMTEVSMYFQIDKEAPILLLDEVLYLCEYLQDGLTAKYFKLLIDNPIGTVYTFYQAYLMSDTFKLKVKNAIIMNAYLTYVKDKNQLTFFKPNLLMLITKPAGTFYRKTKVKA